MLEPMPRIVMMMAVIVAMVIVVAIVMMAMLGDIGRGKLADGLDQPGDIVLQWCEIRIWRAAVFIHVQLAIDLDLNRVFMRGRVRIGAHQLDALVGIVHFYVIPETAQGSGDEMGELRRTGAAT